MEPTNDRMDGNGNPLGHSSVARLIGKFAIPFIISMLVTSVYNITTRYLSAMWWGCSATPPPMWPFPS